MKKPTTTATQPAVYSFDDTPKAFKRMLQRKNGDPEMYKKFKQEQKDHTPVKRSSEPESHASHKMSKVSDKSESSAPKSSHQAQPTTSTSTSATAKANPAAGFKTFRAKRKAHLQTRDLKKKLKKFDTLRELPQHNSVNRKDVRDVVQQPPKLHQVKKAYKKVMHESVDIKSWSDDDDLAEDREHGN